MGATDGVGDDAGAGAEDAVVPVLAGFLIATPLFQINYFPDFTHVYFIPVWVVICPNFLQVAPGVTAEYATGEIATASKAAMESTAGVRLISEG